MHPLVPRPNFLACIVAPTESGKTTTIVNLLLNPNAWAGVFDKVHIISPTVEKDNKWALVQTSGLRMDHWDKEIEGKITDIVNKNENEHKRILFIFDDFIGQGIPLSTGIMSELATSYRHNGISIILSGQKMTALSTVVRTNASHFMVWSAVSGREVDTIVHELRGTLSEREFRSMLEHVWSDPRTPLVVEMRAPQRTRYHNGFSQIVYPNT